MPIIITQLKKRVERLHRVLEKRLSRLSCWCEKFMQALRKLKIMLTLLKKCFLIGSTTASGIASYAYRKNGMQELKFRK